MTAFSGKLQPQAWMVSPETQKVMDALHDGGGDARFVGGCVRNALVNREVLDIDIATPLRPDAVIERLKAHGLGYAPTGIKHGTVTAIVDGHPFEVTTLRLDVATDGRHAEVAFTDDWEADAARRDFTMNAIFATREGDLFDPFGGIADLRNGVVKFVGDPSKRIEEDALRILRFFRFFAHFGRGEPDEAALAACTAAAKDVAKLSGERIRQETFKLLESNNCSHTWLRMSACDITSYFLPEATNVAALAALVQLEARYNCPPFPLRRLAALLNIKDVSAAAQKLKLSNDQSEQLAAMINAKVSLQMSEPAIKKMIYRYGNDVVHNMLLLSAARAGDMEQITSLYGIATSFRAPTFPLRGDDVLKAGVPAGPEVGVILQAIEEWWIENNFTPDRQECLAQLKQATA